MKVFFGTGVCGAIAIGRASVLKGIKEASRRQIKSPVDELLRYKEAKERAKKELYKVYREAVLSVGEENARIFEIHIMMLDDADYNESVENIIKKQGVNAEYAVKKTKEQFQTMFSSMEDAYMKERAADVRDISQRIILELSCKSEKKEMNENAVICAEDLTPSETVSLDKSKVLAFATAHGSKSSHTAILARNMNIAAVVGLGEEFLSEICDGDEIIVDGFSGEVFLKPDQKTKERFLKKKQENEEQARLLFELKDKENITKDGRKINIFANIGSSADAQNAVFYDAGGIGLLRSEFLYLKKSDFPTEEEQFLAYKSVLEEMAGKKVIIRTLDIGADKKLDYLKTKEEENPALGLRAIRLCFENPKMFKTQLRALYRASIYGDLGIMFPMIASVWEVEKILALCEEVKTELLSEGKKYSNETEIGIMIETPAAAIISDSLAPLVDFFSVGTNDLTQYTLACDRQNPRLEKFCDPHHRAVMRLIEFATKNAKRAGKWIGICGEAAADTALTKEFLKMGIDELSVAPPSVLPLRAAVRSIDLSERK